MSTAIQELGRLCRYSNAVLDKLPYCLGSGQLIEYLLPPNTTGKLQTLLYGHGNRLDSHMKLEFPADWEKTPPPDGMADVARRIRR